KSLLLTPLSSLHPQTRSPAAAGVPAWLPESRSGLGEQLDDMPVGVVEPGLKVAVRPHPGPAHADSGRLQPLDGRRAVLRFEREVADAAGPDARRGIWPSGRSRVLVLEDQMDLRLPGLKPEAGKVEAGTLDPLHPQQVDIERCAPLEIPDDERDVIDRF